MASRILTQASSAEMFSRSVGGRKWLRRYESQNVVPTEAGEPKESDIVIDGVVDFDVSGSTGGNDLPYYNRLSLIDGGSPTYSVTIRDGQTYATYLLA